MMPVKKRTGILILLLLVFGCNQVLEKTGVYIPFLYSYADDLLALPIIFSIFHIYQQLVRKDPVYTLPTPIIITGVLGLSFHFELLLPLFSNAYTSDVLDIGMYSLGALAYHLGLNLKKRPVMP